MGEDAAQAAPSKCAMQHSTAQHSTACLPVHVDFQLGGLPHHPVHQAAVAPSGRGVRVHPTGSKCCWRVQQGRAARPTIHLTINQE